MKLARFLFTSCLLILVSLTLNSYVLIEDEAKAGPPPPPDHFHAVVTVQNVPWGASNATVEAFGSSGLTFKESPLTWDPFTSVYSFSSMSAYHTGSITARVFYTYNGSRMVGTAQIFGTFSYHNTYTLTVSQYSLYIED
jgi:hypothetical protein